MAQLQTDELIGGDTLELEKVNCGYRMRGHIGCRGGILMRHAGKGSARQRAAGRPLADFGAGARLVGRAMGIDAPTDALLEACGE
ncbi:MAG: hypothetical protein GY871_04730, partial [Actinomycetales bacterium]|nr:hypothetical protein [Actinomycetales bacterium]